MNKRRLKLFVSKLLEQAEIAGYFDRNYSIVEENSKEIRALRNYFDDKTPSYKESIKQELEKKVVQLSKHQIKQVLGCGMYKCVYLLDNDHALAIGNKSFASKEYKELMQKQHTGTGSSLDIGVFDYGLVGEDLFYVEMSRIIPLEDWYVFTRNLKIDKNDFTTDQKLRRLSMLFVALQFLIRAELYERDASFVLKNIFKIIRDAVASKQLQYSYQVGLERATQILSPNEIRAATKAILNNVKQHGQFATIDVHAGNIGVDMKNPNRMILFDID